MMPNWSIRRAEPRDSQALSKCFDSAYAPYAERIDDLPPVSADCANEIAEHQVWVVETATDIVGGLVLMPQDGFMLLANVAVHPNQKGRGLGRALMEHAEAEARNQSYRELRLSTHVKMPENLSLYAHLGWVETGRAGSKVTMRKVL